MTAAEIARLREAAQDTVKLYQGKERRADELLAARTILALLDEIARLREETSE
jgi:hypothetical protein